MALPNLAIPVADLALDWIPDPTGQATLQVDFTLAEDNDIALVVGLARMTQDVERWIYTPVGADPFNPTYGSPFWSFVGQPSQLDTSFYEAMLSQGETVFKATQAEEFRQGWRTQDDMVDHFENVNIRVGADGLSLVFDINVVSQSGASAPVQAVVS